MTPEFDPWSLLGKAWVAIAGVFLWMFKRHISEDDAHASRVREDIKDLHTKIDANHKQVIDLLLRRE